MALTNLNLHIPFEDDPDLYNFNLELSGLNLSRCLLYLQYNELIDRWFINVQLDGDFILRGVKIVPDVPLLNKIQAITDFGQIFCHSDDSQPITRYSFLNKTAIMGHLDGF